jgi:hypothetical protein
MLTGNPTACWFASFVTFLSNKEKLERFPFSNGILETFCSPRRKNSFYA